MQMGDTTVTFNHFLHIYLAVYDKWTSETEGNVNGDISWKMMEGTHIMHKIDWYIKPYVYVYMMLFDASGLQYASQSTLTQMTK